MRSGTQGPGDRTCEGAAKCPEALISLWRGGRGLSQTHMSVTCLSHRHVRPTFRQVDGPLQDAAVTLQNGMYAMTATITANSYRVC